MKKFISLCLILLLAVAATSCLVACGEKDVVVYEISVDKTKLTAETGLISVDVYALDGTKIASKDLTENKCEFSLKPEYYVVTLVGLDETVSFSSLMLTKDKRKATVTLNNSEFDEFAEVYNFAFTVIMLNGERRLSDLSALICDDFACRDVTFDKGNVVDVSLSGGRGTVEVFDADRTEIYNEEFTLDLNARFYVIQL